ncbi:MAG TPA: GNAT family N-acetyltransferase [Methanomicrobia archaeon]|nr:GNAT family N-acetyltransferase [Methanomicrobia archaeon]HEX59208.1 GNAT family N-acetyltransferase [Methanomicrobia archaeon]
MRIRRVRVQELRRVVDLYLDGYKDLGNYFYARRRDAVRYIKWLYRRDKDGFLVAVERRGGADAGMESDGGGSRSDGDGAEDDHRVEMVGFIASDAFWLSESGRVGAIHEIVVSPERRNLGIGTSLMNAAIRRFKELGLKQVELWVGVTNPARRFYENLGFKAEFQSGIWVKMTKVI